MKPIKSKQAKDMIADMLRKEILSGAIADGEELVQEAIAELLGVSRIPVREAFQILEGEGFLQRLPNRHVKVAGVAPQKVTENLRMVAAVECEVALLLMGRRKEPLGGAGESWPHQGVETTAGLPLLQELATRHRAAAGNRSAAANSNRSICFNLEMDFHRQLSELTENYYLIRLHHSLLEGYPAYILQNCRIDLTARNRQLQQLTDTVAAGASEEIQTVCQECFQTLAEAFTIHMTSRETGHE